MFLLLTLGPPAVLKKPLTNGVTIPKGAVVHLPIHLLHYNPERWTDPEKFDPESNVVLVI